MVIVCYAFLGIGYLILYKTAAAPAAYFASILIGIGGCLPVSFFPMHVSAVVPKSRLEWGIGVNQAVYSLGIFSSTYAVSMCRSIVHSSRTIDVFPIYIAVCIAGTIIAAIMTIRSKKTNGGY